MTQDEITELIAKVPISLAKTNGEALRQLFTEGVISFDEHQQIVQITGKRNGKSYHLFCTREWWEHQRENKEEGEKT